MLSRRIPARGREHDLYDTYDATWYWCGLTQTGFGPDGEPVRADLCRGDRGCCKP